MNIDPSLTPSLATLIVPPEGGEILRAFGDTLNIKLDRRQTGGAFTLAHNTTPPGGGPPPHLHRNEDEMFIVISGQLRYFANGAWTEPLPPGSVVYTPRGGIHTFQNVGDIPSEEWIIATPSGFEQFFARCVPHFVDKAVPPDLSTVVQISDEHGIEYRPPLI